jgi:hypothetical protein
MILNDNFSPGEVTLYIDYQCITVAGDTTGDASKIILKNLYKWPILGSFFGFMTLFITHLPTFNLSILSSQYCQYL